MLTNCIIINLWPKKMNPASVFVLLLFTINIYTIDADDNPTYYHSGEFHTVVHARYVQYYFWLYNTTGGYTSTS